MRTFSNPAESAASLCRTTRDRLALLRPLVFDKGDVYMTGWVFFQYSLLQWADSYVTIEFQCGDVGDSIYDTAILLDAIVAGQ